MRRFFRKAVLIAGTAIIALSCQPQDPVGPTGSEKIFISLGSYRGADGKIVSRTWSDGDKVIVTDMSTGNSAECSPLVTGGTRSAFTFSLKNLQKGDKIVCTFDPSGSCSLNGSTLSLDMPTVRKSAEVPVAYMGSATFMSECDVELKSCCCNIGVQVPRADGRRIKSAVLESNAGEKISENVSINLSTGTVTAGSPKIEYTLPSELDCTVIPGTVYFMVPPTVFRRGFNVTFLCSDGSSFTENVTSSIKLGYGDNYSNGVKRKLLMVGSGKVFKVDAEAAQKTGSYVDGIEWTWTCTAHSAAVPGAVNGCYTDECKPVDDGNKLIVTCSDKDWLMLLKPDYENGGAELLFHLTTVNNVHTAEILPGNRIAVACSTGSDRVELYDIKENSKMIASYPLVSAHGLVWSDKYQRLYAVGKTTLQIYSLKDWDTTSPKLNLEETISTSAFVSHLHDLYVVDENTLSMTGSKVALFDMGSKSFTSVSSFSSATGMKSFNYNPTTGECYYTKAPEEVEDGDLAWATKVVRYRPSIKETSEIIIDVPSIENLYKVRVLNW